MVVNCEECPSEQGVWYDDDGVIRCQKCHTDWIDPQGESYAYLVAQREKNGVKAVQWKE